MASVWSIASSSNASGLSTDMAQLDRLLSALANRGASVLRLVEGEAARLEGSGASQPLTKQVLTAQQLVALVREIAPDAARGQLDARAMAAFAYRSGENEYDVVVTPASRNDGGKLSAEIRVAAGHEPERAEPASGSASGSASTPANGSAFAVGAMAGAARVE